MRPSGCRALSYALDVLVFFAGCVVAVVAGSTVTASGSSPPLVQVLAAIVLVVVMSRFPLVLSQGAGDAVIGFEASVLVFLAVSYSPAAAMATWVAAMVAAHGWSRKTLRTRMFNVGLTTVGGALLVGVIHSYVVQENTIGELVAVVAGCATYFVFDLLVTALSLSVETWTAPTAALRWRSVPLGLLCFVAVDTTGYLAAVLARSQAAWMLALLLVPVGTILIAVRAVSGAQLSQQRLGGLFEAATEAPDWSGEDRLEQALVSKAERILRHTHVELRPQPPAAGEIGCSVAVDGRPDRFLVARRVVSAEPFNDEDARALEALTAVGAAALTRQRLVREMTYQARHDPLTGLSNRVVLTDRLAETITRAPADSIALLYLDLDGFKGVNDRLGHDIGDQLLIEVARRIRPCLRSSDTAARLGGDEFAVLLQDLSSPTDAEQLAQRLHDALEAPFNATPVSAQPSRPVRVRASIGLARAGSGDTAEDIIRNADTAMYRAKALGRDRTETFHPAMRSDALRRLEIEDALRAAVEGHSIDVAYQPIVDLTTGAIVGFEALARWTHPHLGPVAPDVFIPAAEKLGLIGQLDAQVLASAHAGILQLQHTTGAPVALSFNVSPSHVTDPELLRQVAALSAAAPWVQLILEITERELVADNRKTSLALARLKEAGVQLAVDDFGAGYSSIGYLHRLPVDIVKIDRSLVRNLADKRSRLLIQGVVAMATAMGFSVVVEGIETQDDADLVAMLGCDRGQGYLFSRPVPLEQAMTLIERPALVVPRTA
jgi:diguanylate cyclase (GGDEF)-like protein